MLVNWGLQLPSIKICMKKPLVKTNVSKFAQFTKLTEISRVGKFLVLKYDN